MSHDFSFKDIKTAHIDATEVWWLCFLSEDEKSKNNESSLTTQSIVLASLTKALNKFHVNLYYGCGLPRNLHLTSCLLQLWIDMPDHSFYTAGKSVWIHRGLVCLALSDALLHILVETRCYWVTINLIILWPLTSTRHFHSETCHSYFLFLNHSL